jgi:hypothetical protein
MDAVAHNRITIGIAWGPAQYELMGVVALHVQARNWLWGS